MIGARHSARSPISNGGGRSPSNRVIVGRHPLSSLWSVPCPLLGSVPWGAAPGRIQPALAAKLFMNVYCRHSRPFCQAKKFLAFLERFLDVGPERGFIG